MNNRKTLKLEIPTKENKVQFASYVSREDMQDLLELRGEDVTWGQLVVALKNFYLENK